MDVASPRDLALLAICGLDVAASASLAALFFFLARREPEVWLRRWGLGWTGITGAELLIANDILGRPVPLVHLLAAPAALASMLLLVSGTYAFLGRRYSHGWTLAALVGGACTAALDASGVDPVLATAPGIGALALAIAWCGWALVRRGGATRLSGVMLILWGMHAMDYPFLGDVEGFVPFGLAISAFLQIGAALALLLAHLDRSRRALVEATAQERALIDHATVGIFRADASGRPSLANPALLDMLGYDDLDALRERGAADLFVDPGARAGFLAALEASESLETEAVWSRRDGSRLQVHLSGRVLTDAGDAGPCFEGFVVDMTERRRMEAQLDASRRLQAVGRLTGGIAHDFNNLLTVIQGNVTVAMRGEDEDGPLSDALHASERAANLTQQLLAFARAQESQAESAQVVARIEILSRLLARTLPENVTLRQSHASPSCAAQAAPSEVDQIVLNLVINARDALGAAGGTIDVSTATIEGEVRVQVADDGPGLDPGIAETLFEPFATTRGGSDGSGLGLTIVRDLAERRGGRVEVSSAPGAGTTFSVWLPSAEDTEEPIAPPPPEPGSGRVLVVDDDEAVRRVTVRMLERGGYQVLTADGVTSARERLDPSLTAVVSDVMMLDGVGFELAETIEARGLEIPCLFVSGYPDQVQASGHSHALLPKPYRPEQLLSALQAVIDERDAPVSVAARPRSR
ncbi:MAG: ATP-binding protein [Myxococcota bacterium]|nr:ATP-binding protein [Myxococcota bacterium]